MYTMKITIRELPLSPKETEVWEEVTILPQYTHPEVARRAAWAWIDRFIAGLGTDGGGGYAIRFQLVRSASSSIQEHVWPPKTSQSPGSLWGRQHHSMSEKRHDKMPKDDQAVRGRAALRRRIA